MSPETASEPGKYNTHRAPYQRGMMDAINDPAIEEVTFMTAARMGKTTVVENVIGYFIDYDPSPLLLILPTDKLAENWSKINLAPMIRDNECLRSKVAEARSRDSSNKILFKSFPGGHIVLGGANAPTSLSFYSMRLVAFDEVDEYPIGAGLEGDPIDLGRTRAANFLNRKFVYTSTPSVKGLSRIETLWNESDQRLYYVPCPFCNHMQVLVFGPQSQFRNHTTGWLKFDDKNLSWVYYECSNCQSKIGERYKTRMLRAGEWRKQHPEIKHHAGFHINRLYSPWTTWKEIVREFVKAEKRREKLKVWVNKTLGETWVEQESYIFDGDSLLNRRENYERIPPGVIFLTAGVDLQDNRLEIVIIGWGRGEESWLIDKTVIHGSPAYPVTWTMLDAYLATPWQHENGYEGRPGQLGGLLAVGVDTGGHHTKQAYEYVKKRMKRRVFGIKGIGGFGKTFIKQSRNKKLRTPLTLVGVDAGKQLIYDRLMIQREDDKPTPGYMHFNMKCDKEYFDQLTSEKKEIVRVRGVPTQIWKLPEGLANEMLDCHVYNLAAFTLLGVTMETLAKSFGSRMTAWDEAKKKKESSPESEYTQAAAITTPVSRKKRRTISLKKYMGGF